MMDTNNIASLSDAAAKRAVTEYIEQQMEATVLMIVLEMMCDHPDVIQGDGWYSISEDMLRNLLSRAYASGGAHAVSNLRNGIGSR
jgi:hypothetical protein